MSLFARSGEFSCHILDHLCDLFACWISTDVCRAIRLVLRYVSRDEVALFERGTGGVPEVRNCINAYDEKSPLYGFLQYRRRKVVISYMPEGLSRLVQGASLRGHGSVPLLDTVTVLTAQLEPRSSSSPSWISSRRMIRSSISRSRPNSRRAHCRRHAYSTPPRAPSPLRRAHFAGAD